MVHAFEDLIEDLALSRQFQKDAKSASDSIFETLKKQTGKDTKEFKIARAKIAGSVGKGTGISYVIGSDGKSKSNPDLDLVIFVNDVSPPFDPILRICQTLLETMDEIQDISVRTCSMKFKYKAKSGEILNVDLLVAHNHIKNGYQFDVYDEQALVALEDLREKLQSTFDKTREVDHSKIKLYSSAFAESTVGYISERVNDPFILKVVRLAKYWNAKIILPDPCSKVRGRSCVIELIAINAQRKRRGRWIDSKKRCPISGFKRFLEKMENFSTLDVSLNNSTSIKIVGGIFGENMPKPIVQDPVNPLNNLAQGFSPEAIRIFECQAKKTLTILKKLKTGSAGYDSVEKAIHEIFHHKD